MNREELVKKLIDIEDQSKEIRKQLDHFDYLEKYNNAKVYEGKYFKEVNESHPSSIRTIFVYGIDKDCNPMSLCVSYFIGEKTHFEIEYYGHFHPKKWNDSEDWIEITEEEWRGHYNEVQKIINSVLTTN
jgi:hypothetical protein